TGSSWRAPSPGAPLAPSPWTSTWPALEAPHWLLRVQACPGAALTARNEAVLRQLAGRLGGTLSVAVEPRLDLTLVLPGDDAFPVPAHR
ncbi:hypothetical protein, partial [Corallococcus sp. 4LFB]|uniref:hypothetical protein n=1 Tax=Corallococcus sp. 4LFB TaxID=3383249 RepID=UPI003976CE52